MRAVIVAVLYAGGLASFGGFLVAPSFALGGLSLAMTTTASWVSLRGEQLNARECERRRRTGWRLQDDIRRMERELGIKETE